jgi:hypothetical protein
MGKGFVTLCHYRGWYRDRTRTSTALPGAYINTSLSLALHSCLLLQISILDQLHTHNNDGRKALWRLAATLSL